MSKQKNHELQPVKVRELGPFLNAIRPILNDMDDLSEKSLIDVLADHADEVIDMTAIGARRDRAEIEAMEVDELIALAGKVIEVNADFFTRQVMPMIEDALGNLTKVLKKSSKQTAQSAA